MKGVFHPKSDFFRNRTVVHGHLSGQVRLPKQQFTVPDFGLSPGIGKEQTAAGLQNHRQNLTQQMNA